MSSKEKKHTPKISGEIHVEPLKEVALKDMMKEYFDARRPSAHAETITLKVAPAEEESPKE